MPIAAIVLALACALAPSAGSTADLGDATTATAAATTLIVLAAANTTDPLNDVIGVFERDHPGVLVIPEYAGTGVLATQAEHGAPFDAFVSADRAHVDSLAREGLIESAVALSAGHEVIVVPKDNPAGIRSLRDLAGANAKLVLGADTVPIGTYSRQVLSKASAEYGADFSARVLGHVVSFETNVKQVLEKVALGEADGGIVYFTDVTAKYRDHVTVVGIPQRFEVRAVNYIAVGAYSGHQDLARAFVLAATGQSGQSIFRRHGYDPTR